jgi:pimeloyl-ACP methyl ester carboxylesterase
MQRLRISVPDQVLEDLKQRLVRTRWPGEVRASGWDYGTNLGYLKELVEYWIGRYDWRAQERELNRFDHYKAEVDGLGIHFIHQRAIGENPRPLMLIHGWPGSFYEFHQLIPLLTDPMGNSTEATDTFSVVVPSLPGYGFSDDPKVPGMNISRIAEIFHKLMTQVLGYRRYGVQGGDWGAFVASQMGFAYPGNVIGVHLNCVALQSPDTDKSPHNEEARQALAQLQRHYANEAGYAEIQRTKPQTLAYALNDSPAGLAAWIVEKFRTWSDCDGNPERRFTKDQLLTNIMIYWLNAAIGSSMRLYYEELNHPFRLRSGERVEAPTAVAVFPKEIATPPRSWAAQAYNLKRWTVMPRGGHFAAMEEPQLLADDIRAFYRDLGFASKDR